jgi:hypothetical protein
MVDERSGAVCALRVYIATQTPAPQRCPVAHCWSMVQMQKPLVHWPVAPHCAFVAHVPQVPPTHACPPPHWLLAVQFVQTPLTHASPGGPCGPLNMLLLQSANVVHGPQEPFLQI